VVVADGEVFIEDAMSPVSILRAYADGSALVSIFMEHMFRQRKTPMQPHRDVGVLARTECVHTLVDTAVAALKAFDYSETELRKNSGHGG
jgi:propanediol dehydratase large subunit